MKNGPKPFLGPPVVPIDPCLEEGSPKIDYKKGYPYSNLSTGGPSFSEWGGGSVFVF